MLIRWGLERGTSVLPKSSNCDRIRDNLHKSLGFTLSKEEMEELSSFTQQDRMVDGLFFIKGRARGAFRALAGGGVTALPLGRRFPAVSRLLISSTCVHPRVVDAHLP